ncbi:AraD1 family protein [Rhizobacter sp. Root1221]|uniref:AraD1 family protein n=1 Tax=Rhizobacter sp. Root1221 TaxID=1736433 RepID=UPI0006F4DB89|nr:AraD1 family protein [Rhizobacter sp. Root1221]KQV83501.1 FAH family protein [Rhizobacter sp. Root1221]
MRLIQFRDHDDLCRVGLVDAAGTEVRRVQGARTTYELACEAIARRVPLDAVCEASGEPLRYAELLAAGRVLAPLHHPDPAHCLVTGTGLTHLGSAATRDAMHHKLSGDETALSDSMRMFKWGVDGGKPVDAQPGAQPEWFFKGDGQIVCAPGEPIPSPDFALDAGEEPEVVGLYVIGGDGVPYRLGFAIGNEFSDHVTERQNYLYLAHSKLRACAVGPELRTGALPEHMAGTSRVCRGDTVVWEKAFLTGAANMCHSFENLEYHHFKYAAHRRPGDVHLHFFGTSTLSFADGVKVEPGDRFEIDLPDLGARLVNPLTVAVASFDLGGVQAL